MTQPINHATKYAFEFLNAQVVFSQKTDITQDSFNPSEENQAIDSRACKTALDVNLHILPGEFTCICGDNGSGKSTLAKLACALYIPTAGKVKVFGCDTQDNAKIPEIRHRVAYVFQNADDSIIAPDVLSEIAFGCENMGLSREEILARINSAMTTLGIESLKDKLISEISGGQKQLVSIAGALATQPDALILDEPTSMLDPVACKRVIETLAKAHSQGMTILAVTHDPKLAAIATQTIHLNQGRIVDATNTPCANNTTSQSQPTRLLQAPSFTLNANTPSPLDFYILGHAGSNTALRATNVTFGYSDDTPVFSEINLELREGQIVAVLGQCGSGKSTLLKLIAGLLKPTKGQIEWLGAAPLAKQRTQQSKSGILGYAMQFPEKQLFAKDILTDVAFGPKNLGLNTNEAATRARQTLEEIGLAPTYFASKSPFVVSGGEQRKVALAGVLAMSPKVIVMDEPTSALDASTRRDLAAILRHASDTGCAILIATHDAEFINMLAQ